MSGRIWPSEEPESLSVRFRSGTEEWVTELRVQTLEGRTMIKWLRKLLSEELSVSVLSPDETEKADAEKALRDAEQRLLRLEATVSLRQLPRRSP